MTAILAGVALACLVSMCVAIGAAIRLSAKIERLERKLAIAREDAFPGLTNGGPASVTPIKRGRGR